MKAFYKYLLSAVEKNRSQTEQNAPELRRHAMKLRTPETLMVDTLKHLNSVHFLDAFVAETDDGVWPMESCWPKFLG